ncbi:MAG: KEOPS complex subunit Pcc1 [archaeon]
MRCTLTISSHADELYDVFKPENFDSSRARCIIQKDKKSLVFDIDAKDPVSMKACLNSILKIVETYEKVSVLK